MNNPVMLDETLSRLKALVTAPTSKPDQKRRWTLQLIERLLVAERAARVLYRDRHEAPPECFAEDWHDAQQIAVIELRQEGKIR